MSDNSNLASGELRHLDPATLHIDANVRADVALDKDFLASVRDYGVLVPIVALETADAIRVRYGQRRTLAAIQGELESVPVYVTTEDGADEADRIVRQWAENQHRAGLSVNDRIRAVEQLAAFGFSAAQIVKRLKTRRTDVDQALAAAGSDLAMGAVERYGFLTLEQSAAVAEFDDDPDVVKALVAAARDGGFDHVAQRARDDRERRVERERFLAELAEQGVTVIDPPSYSDRSIKSVHELASKPEGKAYTAKTHARCPGAVAWVGSDWRGVRVTHGCRAWHDHGHHDLTSNQIPQAPMTEQQKVERALVIENNRAWRAAETVRREYLVGLCSRRTPPKGAAVFVAIELAHLDYSVRRAIERSDLFGTVLGKPSAGSDELAGSLGKVTENRAQVVTLAWVLAAIEQGMSVDTWRHPDATVGRYLRFLASTGYELSDIEQQAAGAPSNSKAA